MNLGSKDLNLLFVFQVLMEERNVSRAAKRLKLTQPAVSNALSRLRRDFSDPLLVRSSKGMAPTPTALRIWPQVQEFCEQATSIFARETFDVSSQESAFRVATTDYFELVFLADILSFLREQAPRLTLVMRPTTGSLPVSEMESGLIDFAAGGFFGDPPEGFHSVELFKETYSCIVRKGHPLVKKGLDLETFARMDHILVTLHGDLHGVVDRVLDRHKLKRKIVAGVMSFHSPLPIVEASDSIATIPTRIARLGSERYNVLTLPPPIDIPGFSVKLVWHARTHSSRPHAWIRETLRRLIREASEVMGPDSSV
jgi:DNA-binding transcriptional LysR family regulator